jgi:hypothetical protein
MEARQELPRKKKTAPKAVSHKLQLMQTLRNLVSMKEG